MWFKNILMYRFNRDMEFDVNHLEKQLSEFKYTPCKPTEQQKFGWIPALPTTEAFALPANDAIILRACQEQRKIPSDVLKEEIENFKNKFTKEKGQPPKKKEVDEFKDELIIDLLPRAFSTKKYFTLVIMPKEGVILVDSSSHGPAENVLALLRKSLGSLPVVPAIGKEPAENILTSWLGTMNSPIDEKTLPSGLEILDSCTLFSLDDAKSSIVCKNEDLSEENIQNHIHTDKRVVSKLHVQFESIASFEINENYSVKKLKFDDEIKDTNEDIPKEDYLSRLTADWHIQVEMLKKISNFLIESFEVDMNPNS